MKTRRFGLAFVVLTTLTTLAPIRAAAQGEPVRVLSSNGVKAAVDELSGAAQSAVGHTLALQYATTVAIKKKIEAGESFDVTILTTDAIDALIKEGRLAARSRTDMGHAGIGVGIRAGIKKPDIATPDAIKQTLLNAKAVTYASDGASRVHIEKMFDALGITEKMKPKLVLEQGSTGSLKAVTSGKADIILTLVSEILPDKGVELVGPLPDRFQSYVSFAAAVSAGTKNGEAANALIKFLAAPKAASTFKAKGIQTGK